MTKPIRRVAVLGAGVMGSGIAAHCANAKIPVLLLDIVPPSLSDPASRTKAERDGFAAGALKKMRKHRPAPLTHKRNLELIEVGNFDDDLQRLSEVDLVIEAATEDETVKRKIYQQLCPLLNPEAILATNTSSLSITRLASATDRPERFIGIHFMNPVPVMDLVELIRGIATDKATYDSCLTVVNTLGKTAASAEDFPAFIVNRILMPMINEAVYTLYEGVGSVESIDQSMRLGANHPMGPLELADFIGLDTCLAIMNVLHDGLADTKYRPCPLMTKYVEAGWLGRKTQRGFYDYRGPTPVPTR